MASLAQINSLKSSPGLPVSYVNIYLVQSTGFEAAQPVDPDPKLEISKGMVPHWLPASRWVNLGEFLSELWAPCFK